MTQTQKARKKKKKRKTHQVAHARLRSDAAPHMVTQERHGRVHRQLLGKEQDLLFVNVGLQRDAALVDEAQQALHGALSHLGLFQHAGLLLRPRQI